MKPIKVRSTALVLLFLLSFINGVFSQQLPDGKNEMAKDQNILDSVYAKIIANYVEDVSPDKLTRMGIEGMTNALDPFSKYYSKSEADEFHEQINGKFGGTGMVIGKMGTQIVIRQIFQGDPADKAGLKVGDVFLEIEGQSTRGKSIWDILPQLRGAPGTKVNLKIRRPGQHSDISTVVLREEIKISSVPYYGVISGNIGYIRFVGFSAHCSEAISSAISDLKHMHSLIGLVLDLRDNPGGLVREAIYISNFFLNSTDPIFRYKSKSEDSTEYATKIPMDSLIPLVVLVNGSNASASEVLTGAIEDNDRGVVIGQKTFGKGLVGFLFDLQSGSVLNLTIAHYYTPSGRCIQAKNYPGNGGTGTAIPDSLKKIFKTKNGRNVKESDGITPDIVMTSNDLPQIAHFLLDSNYIFNYAIQYKLSHPIILPAADFHITNEDYKKFKNSLNVQKISYQTVTETKINELMKTADAEGYGKIADTVLKKLKTRLNQNKLDDLSRYEPQIKELLEEEIAAQSYYEKGRIEASFKNDPVLKEAIIILNNSIEYSNILMNNTRKINPFSN